MNNLIENPIGWGILGAIITGLVIFVYFISKNIIDINNAIARAKVSQKEMNSWFTNFKKTAAITTKNAEEQKNFMAVITTKIEQYHILYTLNMNEVQRTSSIYHAEYKKFLLTRISDNQEATKNKLMGLLKESHSKDEQAVSTESLIKLRNHFKGE